jgi:hypothetical protein
LLSTRLLLFLNRKTECDEQPHREKPLPTTPSARSRGVQLKAAPVQRKKSLRWGVMCSAVLVVCPSGLGGIRAETSLAVENSNANFWKSTKRKQGNASARRRPPALYCQCPYQSPRQHRGCFVDWTLGLGVRFPHDFSMGLFPFQAVQLRYTVLY